MFHTEYERVYDGKITHTYSAQMNVVTSLRFNVVILHLLYYTCFALLRCNVNVMIYSKICITYKVIIIGCFSVDSKQVSIQFANGIVQWTLCKLQNANPKYLATAYDWSNPVVGLHT